MEFGRINPSDVHLVDFALAQDGEWTSRVLPGVPAKDCIFRVGLAKWGRKEWKGRLYPERLRETDFLEEYAGHFGCIELNAVFYELPRAATLSKWREAIESSGNGDFVFFPKFSRGISHLARLKDCQWMVREFIEGVSALGKYLGPIFLQVGDNFGPVNFRAVEQFVAELPKGHEYYFDFRHKEWFSDRSIRNSLFALFHEHGIGSVITDTSGRRDLVHMELTLPKLFLRFVGNGGDLARHDQERVDAWMDRIAKWKEKGLEEVNFFVHRHDEVDTPRLAGYVVRQLNQRFGAGLREIDWRG